MFVVPSGTRYYPERGTVVDQSTGQEYLRSDIEDYDDDDDFGYSEEYEDMIRSGRPYDKEGSRLPDLDLEDEYDDGDYGSFDEEDEDSDDYRDIEMRTSEPMVPSRDAPQQKQGMLSRGMSALKRKFLQENSSKLSRNDLRLVLAQEIDTLFGSKKRN